MTPISKYLKPYKDAGAANSVIPIHRFVDEHAFLTKSGSIGLALSLEGVSPECLTDENLNGITTRVRSALSAFDDGFRIYQYVVKQDGALLPSSDEYPSQAVAEAVRHRNAALESRGLYSVELYLVILFEPEVFGKRKLPLSNRKVLRVLAAQLARDVDRLKRKAESFVRETADLLHARILPKAETFTFLRTLVNLKREVARALPLAHDSHVDYFLTTDSILVHQNGIQIGGECVEVLSLKDPPRHSQPVLFIQLCRMKARFVLCTEFKPISKAEAV
jgi:type IV secretion system protein TrbE